NNQSLRGQRAEVTGPAGARDVKALQRRMIFDVVRSLAMGDLPAEFAFLQVDGRDRSVGRLDQRQALYGEAGAAAFTTTSSAAPASSGGRGCAHCTARARSCARASLHPGHI